MSAYTLTSVDVSDLLRNAKAASQRSHRELAADAGVATSTVTRIQSARIEPTVDVLGRILDACGFDLRLLAVRSGVESPPRLDDVVDAWEMGANGVPRLDWTRWRAWLDALAQHPSSVPEAIYMPPSPSGHVVIDTLAAAVAEKLADDAGLPRPSWTSSVPELTEPYAPPARRRGPVPIQLERRGVLIDAESLFRSRGAIGVA